jgi:hypothetical protein
MDGKHLRTPTPLRLKLRLLLRRSRIIVVAIIDIFSEFLSVSALPRPSESS